MEITRSKAWCRLCGLQAVLAAGLLGFVSGTVAAEPAGQVIAVAGNVVAEAEEAHARSLSRRDAVYPGETIITHADSRAQIRFRDQGLVDLKPETRLEIESYREATADKSGSAVMNFLGGAMRTLTGAIGGDPDDDYEIRTPTASIGIRGTDYSLQYCDADCAGGNRQLGLYGRVDEGALVVTNEWGTGEYEEDTYFFAAPDEAPGVLLTPPAAILGGSEDGTNGAEQDEASPGGTEQVAVEPDGEADDRVTVDGDPDIDLGVDQFRAGEATDDTAESGVAGYAAVGFVGDSGKQGQRADGWTWIGPDEAVLTLDEEGRLTAVHPEVAAELEVFDMSAAEFETTMIGDAEITWGRWTGNFEFGDDPYTGEIAYAFVDAADVTDANVLQDLRYGSYAYVGGPLAHATDGSAWHIMGAQFDFNFSDGDVFDSSIGLLHEGEELSITVTGTGNIDLETARFTVPELDGDLLMGFEIVVGDADGQASGALVGSEADGGIFNFVIEYDELEGAPEALIGSGVLEYVEPH